MRVDPDHRGEGLGLTMVEHCFEWARQRDATVGRNMVFSWNDAGLGQSVAAGFEPDTAFRFAHPEPDANAEPDAPVTNDPAAAWSYWTASDARTNLSGLALDPDRLGTDPRLAPPAGRRGGRLRRHSRLHDRDGLPDRNAAGAVG